MIIIRLFAALALLCGAALVVYSKISFTMGAINKEPWRKLGVRVVFMYSSLLFFIAMLWLCVRVWYS